MIKTKRINEPPTKPYCVQYGPRSGQRSGGNVNTLVDFSFLRSREGLDLSKLQPLTQEWKDSTLDTIKNFNSED